MILNPAIGTTKVQRTPTRTRAGNGHGIHPMGECRHRDKTEIRFVRCGSTVLLKMILVNAALPVSAFFQWSAEQRGKRDVRPVLTTQRNHVILADEGREPAGSVWRMFRGNRRGGEWAVTSADPVQWFNEVQRLTAADIAEVLASPRVWILRGGYPSACPAGRRRCNAAQAAFRAGY